MNHNVMLTDFDEKITSVPLDAKTTDLCQIFAIFFYGSDTLHDELLTFPTFYQWFLFGNYRKTAKREQYAT